MREADPMTRFTIFRAKAAQLYERCLVFIESGGDVWIDRHGKIHVRGKEAAGRYERPA